MSRKNKNKQDKYRRDARLSVVPPKSGKAKTYKKAEMLDNKDIDDSAVSHIVGRKSYGQKAREQGLYIVICSAIRKFRQENRDCTFADLNVFLQENFPSVFETIFNYPQNLSKIISGDKGWCAAYYSSGLTLIELAEQRMYEVLEKEELDDGLKINAYDKVFKYELARKEMEADQNNTDNKLEFNVNISVEDDNE